MHDEKYLVRLLTEYMYRKTHVYENDIIQLDNNTVYRKADPLDHLEMIMAQTRQATAGDIFSDMYKLISISINRDTLTGESHKKI